jgi:trans-2,3-dihydro-3-hydroxyanthranilate isomerase
MYPVSRRTILLSIPAWFAADFAKGDTKRSRRFPFVQWDVFSKVRLAGNPLIVFPDARGLSGEEMQAITWEINQQETTFVIPREPRVEDKEGIRVRIFLPTKEVPFAGHPSLGTATALQSLWRERKLPFRKTVRLALNVGQVPVKFKKEADGLRYGEMEQPDPQFSSAHDPSAVAPLLGLQSSDIDTSLPIQLVSTGLPYVLVPLKSRDALSRISIDWTRALPWLDRVDPDAMFYTYTLGRDEKGAIQGRGIFPEGEDPATGSASGCLVSLLVKQGRLGAGEQILIEQGDQIHRPSRIYGSAAIRDGKVHSVHIGGYAIQIASGEYVL